MKKETLYGILAGFFGFFILDIVGIHNLIVKMLIDVVLISVTIIYFETKKKKQENREDGYEEDNK